MPATCPLSHARTSAADGIATAMRGAMPTLALAALLALSTSQATAQAPTHPLNDTGQVTCYNANTATGTVSPSTPAPEDPGFEGQDCTHGAAMYDARGAMNKVGASSTKGRDYTKIANDGSVLPASATLGPNPTDWACTRDNVTGLIWEVKVDDPTHLRHSGHTYTWYDTNAAVNGGYAGAVGNANTCANTLGGQPCNTTNFRDVVNALTGANRLCGASDWRLPTANELQSLVDYQAQFPAIDAAYFPNTSADSPYWSGESHASAAFEASYVHFCCGDMYGNTKTAGVLVRLVRGGQ